MADKLWQSKIESALRADRFDLMDWQSATGAVPNLGNADQKAARDLCGHPIQDGFLSLFKSSPSLADPVQQGLEPLGDLLRRGMETPAWGRLRESAVGDHVAAGVGAQAFVEEVLKALPEEAKEQARQQAQKQAEADQSQAQADTLNDLLDLLRERAQGNPGEANTLEQQIQQTAQHAARAQAQAQAAQQQADTARAEYQSIADANAPQIAAACNAAAQAAQGKAGQASEMVRGFSLAAGGDPSVVDPETARAAMQALQRNPNLNKLAEMLGWARRMARAEWRKSPRGRTEMVGYKAHDLHPEAMASFEWAGMLSGDETLETDWTRRAVDGGIRHRHYQGEEQQGRGPMVLVRDESGSMSGAPHSLAVALEWALLEIARRDGREFVSIPFSGKGQYNVWQAPATGQPDAAGLLAHLSHFYNGGTEPYAPLVRAFELIQAGLRADVLVLTDADFAPPPAEFLARLSEAKQRCPLRIVAVVIGADDTQARAFADQVVHVHDLVRDREQLRAAVATVV